MLVDSGDRAGLTAMLDRVVADRDLRTRLSAAAPARAAHFDIEESARTVESFLEDVLDTPMRQAIDTSARVGKRERRRRSAALGATVS